MSYHSYTHPVQNASVPHNHGSGRSRRTPRLTVSQNSHRQFRGVRSIKELTEAASLSAFRTRFEAGRSFDLEDDLEFCPGLLTESDVSSPCSGPSSPVDSCMLAFSSDTSPQQLVSISSSERSSLASNSPQSSPTQQPQTVAPVFSLNSSSPPFIPPMYTSPQSSFKLHQPSATRGRNAIPIVNPATGISMPSPPLSLSPSRMPQSIGRRW